MPIKCIFNIKNEIMLKLIIIIMEIDIIETYFIFFFYLRLKSMNVEIFSSRVGPYRGPTAPANR